MNHKKTLTIVQKFLEKTQAWVDKTPAAESVSMETASGEVIIAKRKSNNSTG